ncbi:hypothetical protein P691DRAFT_569647 [Macrolepiota fuliginosa MF-IS2]|uniref:F-box domain-containing protein n=1 Tax=Macrolepiota fuliginosa MF-IS2 TaxID=1400762 RepID=A0A9P5WZQ7_9AGAR|nr:hypothetical protein P691DRAFT_569647 [Macrolepiota fuliginosa MF-IS2]
MDSPSHCSSCGQIKLDVDVERLIFSNPTIEFDEAIAQVDIRIRELFEVRAALCRQSNQTRSHVYRLPPETLSLIFQEVCAPPLENWEDAGKVNYHAIILSSVSSYWHQVALGTARMWNEMAFGVREGAMKSAADLFQHHTRHAKDLDLSVSVFFEGCSRDSEGPSDRDASDHQALENILFSDEVAQRIITLYLVGVPLKWGSTQRHWGLPRVHTMYISGAQDAPIVSRYQVLDTPCLHRLHVAGESWDLLVIPPTLRTLVLSGTLPGTNVDLPSQCPATQVAHVVNP